MKFKEKQYDKKIFRLMYILNKLDNREKVNTHQLKDEFNVSIRTIQRDLQLLNMLGYPIVKDKDSYRFMEGFSLGKVIIEPIEKDLLISLYRFTRRIGSSFTEVFKEFLNKVLLFSDKEKIFSERRNFKKEKKKFKEKLDFISEFFKREPIPVKYKKRINLFVSRIKKKIERLKTKEKIDINILENPVTSDRQPVLVIEMPSKYFKDLRGLIDDLERFEKISFKVSPLLSRPLLKKSKSKILKVSLEVEFYLKVVDFSLRKEDISCFDSFAKYLGFTENEKDIFYSTFDESVKLYWVKKLR